MYRQWLYLTCKWTAKGLDITEFDEWQELTTKLNKHCQECQEGYICISCRNTGLHLTGEEKLMIHLIEQNLNASRTNTVN
jgi:hypothetical protein